jgi:hypothetical protein
LDQIAAEITPMVLFLTRADAMSAGSGAPEGARREKDQ